MKVRQLDIRNFRGVANGSIRFGDHALLVGSNNVGKSTVCEALDLVLGLERMRRRPVVDEHDFHLGEYLDHDDRPISIRITATLVDLTDAARRKFQGHLRRWDNATASFIDEEAEGISRADDEDVVWALQVTFIGRYDEVEDDFVGDTFFSHPDLSDGLDDEDKEELGAGLTPFRYSDKRLCGFVYLRALRTGSRALSLQRGSLLDTILKLGGDGAAAMWKETLKTLRELDPAIGEIAQLKAIRDQMRDRLTQFVNLAPGDESSGFFASDLTRANLREVVKLFVATQPSEHLVPYARQGTGSINLIVFALLTLIAELRDKQSVIFAMEEPEIALPPHTQRRVTRFVLREMGQTIVTSHSPYVIEEFEPTDVVMITRSGTGDLVGTPIPQANIDRKRYRTQRRQFAEAILARAVIVVEGATEASLFPAVSSAMERLAPERHTHFDLAGISMFATSGDGEVPQYGPIFSGLGKRAFGVYDQPNAPLTALAKTNLASYEQHWESPEKGIERLIVKQTTTAVLRRFLDDVSQRSDYPNNPKVAYSAATPDADLAEIAFKVLKARKGDAWGYAAMVIEHCETEAEIPEFIREVVGQIDAALAPPTAASMEGSGDEGAAEDEDPAPEKT